MLNMMETMEVKSLRMCEERRRKTRRGKKRRNGVSLENTESSGNFDDFTTSYVNYHPYLHSSIPEVNVVADTALSSLDRGAQTRLKTPHSF